MSMICFLLFCLSLDSKTVTLSSDEHSGLFYPYWFYGFQFHDDDVIFVVEGDAKAQQGLTIYLWHDDHLEKMFTSTPREGIFSFNEVLLSKDGSELFVDSYHQILYRYQMGGRFERVVKTEQPGQITFLDEVVVYGYTHPKMELKSYMGESPSAQRITKNLPEEANHVCQTRVNLNKMLLASRGQHLAVGFSLHDAVYLYNKKNGELLDSFSLQKGFPGYLPAPDSFDIPNDEHFQKMLYRWLGSYHYLTKLTWFGEGLYGFYRKGTETHGVWARLDKKDFHYDNDQHDTKLLVLGPDRVILGKVREEEGEVIWDFWQSSSLPTRSH